MIRLDGGDPTVGAGFRIGWQAGCRRCGRLVWVGETGLMYSVLGEQCKS